MRNHAKPWPLIFSFLVPLGTILFVVFRSEIVRSSITHLGLYLSPDGVIADKTVDFLIQTIAGNSILIVLFSFVVPLYVSALTMLPRHLPEHAESFDSRILPSTTWRDRGLLFCVFALAIALRAVHLFDGLIDDEISSMVQFIKVPTFIQTVTTFQAFHNHLGYSVVARILYKLVGEAEWVYRLPSIVTGIATIYPLWLFARKYTDRKVAMVSILLLAILPLHVSYSARARGYVPMTFFSLVSTYLFLDLLQEKNFRKSLLFILSSICAIYFHFCGVFPLIVQILFFFGLTILQIGSRLNRIYIDRERFVNLLICFGIVSAVLGILYSPVLLQFIHNLQRHGRQPFQPTFPAFIGKRFFGSFTSGAINFALIVAGFVFLLKRQKMLAIYLLMMVAIPFLSLWLASPADLVARLLYFEIPFFCFLVSAGFLSLFRISVPIARPALIAVGIVAFLYDASLSFRGETQSGFREAARAMNQRITPQTVLCATGDGAAFYQYYSANPIYILRSHKDLEQLLPNYSEVRCAYMITSWPSTDPELLKFLVKNSRIRRFYRTAVFVYRKDDVPALKTVDRKN